MAGAVSAAGARQQPQRPSSLPQPWRRRSFLGSLGLGSSLLGSSGFFGGLGSGSGFGSLLLFVGLGGSGGLLGSLGLGSGLLGSSSFLGGLGSSGCFGGLLLFLGLGRSAAASSATLASAAALSASAAASAAGAGAVVAGAVGALLSQAASNSPRASATGRPRWVVNFIAGVPLHTDAGMQAAESACLEPVLHQVRGATRN